MTHGDGRRLGALSLMLALAAAPGMAQDTTHARGGAPPAPDTAAKAPAPSIVDTMAVIHITVDSTRIDSLALDTLRRALVRDSARVVAVRDSARSAVNCEGRQITAIDVRPQPPNINVPDDPRLTRIARRLTALHAVTRTSVIRRFLALRVGEVCVERRRAESERLLRAQPFIESAHIAAYPDGPTGVRLDVFTVDAVAGEIGIGVQGQMPLVNQLRLGNGNLLGAAIRVSGQWAHENGYRDRFAGEFEDFQAFGRPWIADVSANLDHVGGGLDAALTHPYFTDLQRIGWRAAGGSNRQYIRFRRPVGDFPTLDLQRDYANAGGLMRIGNPSRVDSVWGVGEYRHSRLALVGFAVSHEGDAIGGRPVILTSAGPVRDTTAVTASAFAGRYGSHNVDRVNVLFGLRGVRFLTVRGFDALLGEQDIPIGSQISAVVGRSAAWLGSGDHDLFLSGRLDVAAGTTTSILRGGAQSEVRRDESTGRWDDLITSGRLAWYLKPALTRTVVVSGDVAFGQRNRVPFQLALGDPNGGVRGYLGSRAAGATRLVGRAEYRTLVRAPWHVLRSLATWGLAGFVDGGRVWAGDVPFGTTTPMVAAAGVGLLVGFPPTSRQVWRVDVAMPLVASPRAGLELRVSTNNTTRVWWTEPADVTRSRERTVTPSLFSYP